MYVRMKIYELKNYEAVKFINQSIAANRNITIK